MALTPAERRAFIKDTKTQDIPFPEVDIDPSDGGKYEQLHQALYRGFMDTFRGTGADSSSIGQGFRIHARIIGRAPVAFARYVQQQQAEKPCYDQFLQTMLASCDAALEPLCNTDIRRNATLEAELGLLYGNEVHYRFLRTRGSLVYRPDPLRLMFALSEIEGREESGDLAPHDPRQACPALRIVLPRLWDTVVRGCMEDKRFFMADFEGAFTNQAQNPAKTWDTRSI